VKFADFHPGQRLEAGPYEINEAEIIEFARAYDPQWFHTDTQASATGRFSGLIASGWHTCAIAMRLVVDTALKGSESFASPGLEYVKWPAPVRPGDSLSLRVQVLDVRRSSKSPKLGILHWRWHLVNQQQIEVLELEATSFFDLTDEDKA